MPCLKWIIAVIIATGVYSATSQQTPAIRYTRPENISAADGLQMFRSYCSACHGMGGLGNGPAAGALQKRPADLTQLSRRNNGKFPVYRVRNEIQGAGLATAHGSREMPVWGNVFRTLNEDTVKLRVDNLTGYIESLQRK
jgi:mono/diheme cytochrome c family protein